MKERVNRPGTLFAHWNQLLIVALVGAALETEVVDVEAGSLVADDSG